MFMSLLSARGPFFVRPSYLLDVADLRGKDFEHRLHAGIGQRLLAERGLPVAPFSVRPFAAGAAPAGRFGAVAARRTAIFATGDLLRHRFEPGAVLLERVAQRPLAGENVNVTRSAATSIFCACATTML